MLSRQSDRNFPRTKFGSSILSATKKEGSDFSGMLLGLLIAMPSDRGRESLLMERGMEPNRTQDQVHMIEALISMEEWLKHGAPTRRQLAVLPTVMMDFTAKVNFNGQRQGMGTKLIKNHLHFHLPQCVTMWGPPKGWDSSASKSHHKTKAKAPAKTTQQRSSTMLKQTSKRHCEKRILEKANSHWNLQPECDTKTGIRGGCKGPCFLLVVNLHSK